MNKTVICKRRLVYCGILAGMFFLLCIGIRSDIYAAQKRPVKVAFFPMEGYHTIGEDGTYSGMDVAYLDTLCQYVNWQVEYVACDSWEDALEKLSNKEVDLVGSAQYSASRAEVYQYADLSSGYTFGVIATMPESTIAYEDFVAMKKLTYGMVENYVRKAEFLDYLSHHGILNPKIKEYSSTAELHEALEQGEVDAFVHTFTEVKEGQRMIGRFAPRPFYYITYQGNDELIRELNQGIVDLKMNQPELETTLMNQFFYDKFDKAVLLTTEEKKYLEEKKTLFVGYIDNAYPFSYDEDGKFKGLAYELLERSLGITGLQIEYVKMDSRKAARDALKNGEIDLYAYSTDVSSVLAEYQLSAICDYVDVPLVLVTKKNKSIDDIQKLSTVTFLEEKAQVSNLGGAEIVTFEDQQDSIDALVQDDVDAVLSNGYLVEYLMRTNYRYGDLQIRSVVNETYSISLAARENEKLLASIISKTVLKIDSRTINEYTLRENVYPLVSIADFISQNSLLIISILIVIMIVVISAVLRMLRDSRKIQRLMYKDSKLDIWNMNYLTFWGEHKILPERKSLYALICLNLSHFRRFNIIYGWTAGEQLLEMVSKALVDSVDEQSEICARNQGDRFVMLLRCTSQEELMERIQHLKKEIETRIQQELDDRMMLLMGVYFVPANSIDMRDAINNANQALEYTNSSKDSAIMVYDDSLEKLIKERHEKEKVLESVDIQKDFVVFYQSKVDIRTEKIVGAEALVRFKDPTDGGRIKAPFFFVPYYEQTGKIMDLDFFVYESVCKMIRRRIDAGSSVVPVSCNFSRMHFIRLGFADRFIEVLNKYDIPKTLIEVEITETMMVEEMQNHIVKQNMDELKAHGIHLSIDDFGAGYSSLGVFEQIPASVIKMDRSFLLNQEDRGRQVKIMRGIVKLSEELEAQIVCEGVETQDDVLLMQEIGAYIAQGYYYSKPIPEDEFEEKLNAEA